ncbi:hypothetical protein K0M31_013002 [Melipona bicolor]|uniref:Uncharacterized protein n=1 Tax=Melipona bicolor TaxID=60889 RepID=A0AA40FIY1_9HYME|nr:hypothetical protein K0M31_013002 [Melipona bicolor]
MNPTKWNLVSVVMLLLISTATQTRSIQNSKRFVSTSNPSIGKPSYWEYILRESVFKTISPSPRGNHHLYRRLLEAPFYDGPFPIVSNSTGNSVVLSRGHVYHLPNGHWLFCQQGCTECGACVDHTHPTVKWMLRRIKRNSSHGATRHDLELTIVPQIDGSYHMRSLWPQSYVYVTSEGERDTYLNDRHSYRNDVTAYVTVEDDPPGQAKSGNFWSYTDRNSLPERRVLGNSSVDDAVLERRDGSEVKENLESTTVPIPKSQDDTQGRDGEEGSELKNVKRQRPEVRLTNEKQNLNGSSKDVRSRESGSRTRQLVPKLILGTDQTGQKHLVHVVPADGSTNASLMNSLVSNVLNSTGRNRTAYQRILRRIFDSLSNNRRSIENFLEPLTSREKLSQRDEEHQQQETRSGFSGLRSAGLLYPLRAIKSRNESSSERRWPYTLNWRRVRGVSNNNAFANRFLNNAINNGSYVLNPKMQNKNASNSSYDNNTSRSNSTINNVSRNR